MVGHPCPCSAGSQHHRGPKQSTPKARRCLYSANRVEGGPRQKLLPLQAAGTRVKPMIDLVEDDPNRGLTGNPSTDHHHANVPKVGRPPFGGLHPTVNSHGTTVPDSSVVYHPAHVEGPPSNALHPLKMTPSALLRMMKHHSHYRPLEVPS